MVKTKNETREAISHLLFSALSYDSMGEVNVKHVTTCLVYYSFGTKSTLSEVICSQGSELVNTICHPDIQLIS